jgi:hypothetical protein
MFTAMGQALQDGHATRTASASGFPRFAIDIASPAADQVVLRWY